MDERTAVDRLESDEQPLDLSKGPAWEAFGFLLAMSAHRFRLTFERELEPMGMLVKHFAVLAMIDHYGPVSQHQLGSAVCIDRSTMVALLDEMQGRGLVRRGPDPADRRAHRVDLTDSGKRMLARAKEIQRGVEDECLGALSLQERSELKAMLQRVVDLDAVSGFEHINIKVSARSGEPAGGGKGR